MLKFIIITRRHPGFSRERYFYEWAFIHVSLMLHTAPSMRRFKRYVQHFVNPDLTDDDRVLPRPAMNWEGVAEHWVERFNPDVSGPEYVEQMQPHKFSDSAMEIVYLDGHRIWQRGDFKSGGIKLIHRLAKPQDMDARHFEQLWRHEHVPLLLERLQPLGLRKLEIDLPYAFDAEEFRKHRKGTLFERAEIEPAAGFEELWFDSLEDAVRLGRDPHLRRALETSYARFTDRSRCYSLLANERVVYDYATPGELSPPPAVLDASTLDASVFRTGRPYHEPRLE